MRKLLSILLAALIVMTACAPALAQTEPHTITIMHRWTGTNEAILGKVIEAFEAANPDVHVEVVAMAGQYFDLLQSMLADAAAGNDLPDLFIGGYNLLNYIAEEMNPTPIDALAPSQEAYDAFVARFDENIYNMTNYNGVQVGVPYALSNMVLYYNKDIFKAAGLTEEDVPTTWAQVKDVSLKIVEKTDSNGIVIQCGDSWADQALIYSAGGRILTEDGKKLAIDDEGTIRAYEMWQDLYKSGATPLIGNGEMNGEFIAGTVAMYATSIMKLASFNNSCAFEYGIAPCPSFEGHELKLTAGGAAAIPFAKTDADKDATWRLLNYMLSDEGMKTFVETGYLCVTNADVPVYAGQEVAYAQRPNAVAWTCWPGGSIGLEIDAAFLSDRLEILHNGADPTETLKRMCEEYNDLL